MSKLKPCPFCGGEALSYSHVNPNPGFCQNDEDHWVSCTDEDCSAAVGLYDNAKDAIANWNKRVKPFLGNEDE